MALGSNSGGKNLPPLIILKVVDKDKDKKKVSPYFSVSRKVDGKYALQSEQYNRVSGTLSKIDIKEQEWNGEKYNTVALYLKDGDETYLIDLRFNLAARSLFNSLASLEDFANLGLTVYENKSGWMALGLWQNDKMVKWRYKLEELPTPDAVTFKGKEMHDYSKVDEFFSKVLREISGKLGGNQKTVKVSGENPATEDALDKNVPF